MKLLGILGQAGSGKDTLADWLASNHKFVKVAIADPLKRHLKDIYLLDDEQLWGPSPARGAPDVRYMMANGEPFTARVGAQRLGDIYRELWPEAMVAYMRRVISSLRDSRWSKYRADEGLVPNFSSTCAQPKGIVVTDLRMPDEVRAVQEMGGKVVRLRRQGATGQVGIPNHQTERQGEIPDSAVDKVILVHEGLDAFKDQLVDEMSELLA